MKFLYSALPLVALFSQASAHAVFSNQLGVSGVGVRNNALRPSTASLCGGANVADIDTTTAAVATNGLFNAAVTNFNAGTDGSTAVKSAVVDTTGLGKTFPGKVTVVKNGVQSPTSTGTVQLQLQLPAGTACTGGATKNKCLVSLTTDGGFGGCVVIQTANAATTGATGTTTTTTTGTTGTTTTTTNGHKHHHNQKNARLVPVEIVARGDREGSRNARSFVDSLAGKMRAVRSLGWKQMDLE